jgi:DEAD/DEAH box helicase domain-containing protein
MDVMRQLILDVETQKIFDQVGGYFPEKLGISFVGAIVREGFPETGGGKETRYEIFEKDLSKLWPVMEQADVLIGFNTNGFDLPVLSAYYPGDITKLPSLDLLEVVRVSYGRRISLDSIAKETLKSHKSGSGLDAIAYYENGELDKLASYCMKDVEITRDIYDYGRQHKKIMFQNHWNNRVELPVNFHFNPQVDAADLQLTLV